MFHHLARLTAVPLFLTHPFPPAPLLQLKVKTEELLEVYRQQDGAGAARKVPQAGSSGSSGGGGLLARLRSGSSSGTGGRK
jgi:hypothetical protein